MKTPCNNGKLKYNTRIWVYLFGYAAVVSFNQNHYDIKYMEFKVTELNPQSKEKPLYTENITIWVGK